MSKLFEDLKQGLEEAIAFEKGKIAARVTTYDSDGKFVSTDNKRRIVVSSKNKDKEKIVVINN